MADLNHRFPVYSRLLHLYPHEYRREFGEQMLQTLADMLDDPVRSKAKVWARAILDYPLSVIYQQISFTGAVMNNQTPDYMKRNAVMGAVLLIPFFVILVISSFASIHIPDSPAWKRFFWVMLVILPLVAFALNISSFLRWVSARRRQDKASLWKVLSDVRPSWSALLVAGLGLLFALFLPFHDSAHCIAGNPVRELHNWHDTWQCTQQR